MAVRRSIAWCMVLHETPSLFRNSAFDVDDVFRAPAFCCLLNL
jgi:hypothetical protein